ncbi:response regulator [Massilia niabensis]|uniref:Response regulator n=1 Tax=Massilia niabensis TaxID=544910 RepID=A0ABW0L6S5_9BURK
MQASPIDRHASPVVLIVDDVPENLAVLHDALDEAGFMVLVANSGAAALERVEQLAPDIILLDAVMPGMDGFETCRRLRAHTVTRATPIIFMTGLTEAEHVVSAFGAGGTDYVTKPVRQSEVLARIGAHLNTARLMNQAHSALDAFGNAALAVTPGDGRIVWQTPLARQWMQKYFPLPGTALHAETPAPLEAWLAGGAVGQLTIARASSRLVFSLADSGGDGGEQRMVVLREESDGARVQALMALFRLTQREAEVLHWAMMGKTNRDIGDILGTSPRTVNKHLEHVFSKLGVETRTAAAALAVNRLRGSSSDAAGPAEA